jgi:FKBP-type peptidyl-prolyl cis-trans isomerase SlyD
MKIGPSKVVEIHFALKKRTGDILDETPQGKPLTYFHGSNYLLPGMEETLQDLESGDTFDATISPEKGYGLQREDLVQEVSREQFVQHIDLKVSQQFMIETPQGPKPIHIKALSMDTVTIDGNHPLADQTLHFAGNVVSVRDATEEEIKQGGLAPACDVNGGCC